MPPLNLTTPAAGPTVASYDLTHVHINVRDVQVVFVYVQLDGATPPNVIGDPQTVGQGPVAFVTAFVTASGGLRARLYAAFQAALGGPAGTVV